MTTVHENGAEESTTVGDHGFDLMSVLAFIAQRKELLVVTFVMSLLLTYGSIYVFIDEQFEGTTVIVPNEDKSLGGLGDVLRGMKGLPFGLGSQSIGSETDLYKTIIYSRTLMENVIHEFGLINVYDLDTLDAGHMEKAVKRLRDEIIIKETEESAFLVTARATTRQRAAEMANFVVRRMNEMIVDLKASSSRESRIFLEKRVDEIKAQLRASEDSLRTYQERTGFLDTKQQVQGILEAHSTFESELIARELQKGILQRGFDKESPQVKAVEVEIEEYKKKLEQLRTKGEPGGALLALKKLPETAVEYVRRFREVEIGNLLLEFIMPIYEQAKIEEKKDYPIVQVIDYAVPPVKKSWPPRMILSFIGAISVTFLVAMVLVIRRSLHSVSNPRWRALLDDARHWTWTAKSDQ